MKKWRCTICGYIHEGENPPDECPLCGAGPEFFEEVLEETSNNSSNTAIITPKEINSETNIEEPTKVILSEDDKKKIDPALFKISYGMYIITSKNGDKINGQCANTGFQITSQPPQVAIGINKNNYTHEFIEASGIFVMNILDEQAHNLVRRFGYSSGRDMNKFDGINYFTEMTGAPILKDSLAYLECRIIKEKSIDAGTHTLYLAEVINGKLVRDIEPMTYAYFRKTK